MTGAVILAAGSGYDPESFQPMLTVSGTSAVKKQISTLREAGISRFIVVTGYQAEQLEKHLSHRGVTFVRNPDYRTSQMLDSIRYALAAAEDWERALILPVDLPSFRPETIQRILETEGQIVIPRYNGQNGHPIAVRRQVFDTIASYQGEDGLRGIFRMPGYEPVYKNVEDPAILLRASTRDRYQELLNYEKQSRKEIPLRAEVAVSLFRKQEVFDKTLADFLESVEEMGSMNSAAQKMGMAYSRAWKMTGNAEEQLGFPLIMRQTGGSHGGSSCLTPEGKAFLAAYRDFQQRLRAAATQIFQETIAGFDT